MSSSQGYRVRPYPRKNKTTKQQRGEREDQEGSGKVNRGRGGKSQEEVPNGQKSGANGARRKGGAYFKSRSQYGLLSKTQVLSLSKMKKQGLGLS